MLDIHILNYKPNPIFWAQCIASVETAINNADYPINLHVTKGYPDFGKARAEGFSSGGYPYVTYVDNDDYVLPDAFQILKPALEQKPDALFTRELQLCLDGQLRTITPGRHHLQVYNRKVLIDHQKAGQLCDLQQLRSVDNKRCIDLPDQVYVWRTNPNSMRAK